MDLGIAGRSCVVTGASRGIGLATARALVAEGGRVLLVARNEDALSEAAASLSGEVATMAVDVNAAGAPEELAVERERRFGAAGVLGNNAGASRARSVSGLT